MAAMGVSSVKSEKSSRTFTESLSSAFLEWMLLFLLFVNALFSYLTTKFARYCGLQTPCLLCSRLDHILGKERLGFYWDMICCHHKSEISSLVLCHAHCKLVDVHGICENCLFSFATINKSNAETYRLLVGKLGVDSDSGSSEEEQGFPSEGHRIGKSSMKLCSCCSMPWISRGPKQTLIQTTSIMSQLADLDVPLSSIIGALKNIGDGSSKRINRGIGDLSHIGYTELKITSDTESEVPFSDDDEINSLASKPAGLREKSGTEPCMVDLLTNISSSDTVVKLEQDSASLPGTKVKGTKCQKDESVGTTVGHCLEGINLQNSQIKDKDALASTVELISFDDFPSEVSNGATFEKLSSETCKYKPPSLSPPSEPCENDPTVRETNEAPEKDLEATLKVETEPITTEKPVEANLVSTDSSPQVPNLPDLGEACKLAVGNHGGKLSGVLIEQLSKDSSSRVSGDLKNLFSQLSALQVIDQSSAPDLSPNIYLNSEDSLKTLDALQKPISLERNESGPSEPSVRETNEAPEKDSEETLKVETEPITKTENPVEANTVSTDSSPRVPNLPDLSEAYKLAVRNHGKKFPGVLTEQWLSKDSSSRVSGDLKNLFSQLSAPQGIDQSSAPDLSPKISLNSGDSLKTLDTLQKRILLERNELSPYEPSVRETNEAPEEDLEETLKAETETITPTENPVEAILVSTNSSPRVQNLLDLGEAYKLAVGNRGRQFSGVLTEQWLSKDSSSRVSEDLKNLFSQLSAPRGIDQSSAPDLSPKISLNSEGSLKTLDALQKRISLERNESGLSQDGSLVSEIEGESTIDRLKRQIEHDRRALSTLYKELEEERNASAVAANQAMAMITRLQEEKATLQMEALQYLRMMEEQAEYDMEALQKSNDLLSEREKEIQDLEEELDFYRINFGDENQIPENLDIHLKAESIGPGRLRDSAIGFEDERLHILESLKTLEKKLGLSSGNGVISDLVNCESRCSGKEEASVCDSTQNDFSLPRDVSLGSQEEQETSPDNDTRKGDCVGKSSSVTSQGIDLTSIKNEVLHLQKRFEVLEADRNFLERTVRHLRIGEEGLQFARDIASRLQEIRNTLSKADHQTAC